MTKQPFTIGGSVALKKALSEETGIPLNCKEALNFPYLTVHKQSRELEATSDESYTHYQLPEEYDVALQAVKDFFTENPKFEAGKWYYTKEFDEACIYKFSRFDDNIPEFSEVIALSKNGRVLTYTNQRFFNSTISRMQPATPKQIQEMLGKVAEQRGLVEAAVVNSIHVNNVTLREGSYVYKASTDTLYFGGQVIYQAGKWAELLPQEAPETLVLRDVKMGDVIGVALSDIELTAEHLQQLKAALAL